MGPLDSLNVSQKKASGVLPQRESPAGFIFNPKHLFMKSEGILANRLGEQFTLSSYHSRNGLDFFFTIKSKDREAGTLEVNIDMGIDREHKKVKIWAISTAAPPYNVSVLRCPEPEHRGYGIMRIVLSLAKEIARERGIEMITVVPSGRKLDKYYSSFGFREEPETEGLDKHEMVFRLRPDK